MQKPETKFRASFRPKLEAIPNSFWESIQQKTIKGTPDILGVVGGTFIAIELKAGRWQATELQKLKLKRIEEAGGIALVVNPSNASEVLSYLRGLHNVDD